MNKNQKLVQQQFINNEEAVIRKLKNQYHHAYKEIEKKAKILQDDINRLGTLANLAVDDEEKAKLLSMQQSKVYQKQYQDALKKQIGSILDNMQVEEFKTISEYLSKCYEDGFIGTMFDLQGQGIPLCFPLDQEAMVRAIQLDSQISRGLYTRLGEDVSLLKKKITAQVSRGISTGMSFEQIAKQLAGNTNIGYNNAIRIARTEGHRIQVQAGMDACYKAKDMGADVVKQWDSTLDSSTRESHAKVDGEIRELDKKFSNGLMFPGDPSGGAAEVCNCRCALLQRARWALEDSFTKMNNFTKQLETFETPAKYDEFKKAFFSKENRQFMNYHTELEKRYGTKNFEKLLDKMTDAEYKHWQKLYNNSPIYNNAIKKLDLKTPGEIGEKAIPYSQRGIEIETRLKGYINQLHKNGDYISAEAGTFKGEDLAILTTETGVEYTSLTIGKKSYLIRGTEKGTMIPEELKSAIIEHEGTLDFHSHPFIGDLVPSSEDKEFLKLLTWQGESVIIDPEQSAVSFTVHGTTEKFKIETDRTSDYWSELFEEGD